LKSGETAIIITIMYNDNRNIHLSIQSDQYVVRLLDIVVADDKKIKRN